MTVGNDISELNLRRSEFTGRPLTSVGDIVLSKYNVCNKSQKSETCKCCEIILKQNNQQEEIFNEKVLGNLKRSGVHNSLNS